MMMSKSKSVKLIQNGDQSRAGPDQNVPTKIFFLLEKRFSYFGSLCFKMLRPVDLMQSYGKNLGAKANHCCSFETIVVTIMRVP